MDKLNLSFVLLINRKHMDGLGSESGQKSNHRLR